MWDSSQHEKGYCRNQLHAANSQEILCILLQCSQEHTTDPYHGSDEFSVES
jgi:hypothetical protein